MKDRQWSFKVGETVWIAFTQTNIPEACLYEAVVVDPVHRLYRNAKIDGTEARQAHGFERVFRTKPEALAFVASELRRIGDSFLAKANWYEKEAASVSASEAIVTVGTGG
jgi:hypothetical protein